ncbi:MAG: hypothetical protein LBJ00_09710, partial [Planctomycetaceae bacterium]|nr:hypothetical protein [Planctomycetaceae bacterium]
MIFLFGSIFGNVLLSEEFSGVPTIRQGQDINIVFGKIDIDKFAEHIRSKKIYDPKLWGADIDRVQVRNALFATSHLADFKLSEFMRDSAMAEKNFSSSITHQQAITKRRAISKAIMTLQNFFEETIDRDCPKNNPFFVDSIIDSPEDPMEEYRWQIGGWSGAIRFAELMLLETKKELTEDTKQELLKFRALYKTALEKHDKWMYDMTEYTLQKELMEGQKKSLKESHAHLVKLYSLEPRADGELLELFSKSKYPETEKVKILMELKIPYKNFRYWESQNRRFRTVAQFVSFDKNK